MKIYMVTSGEYSDYKIHGVFSKKEKAQKFVDIMEKPDFSDFDIEEWELDKFDSLVEKFMKKKLSIYAVIMFKDGRLENIEEEKKRYVWIDEALSKKYNIWKTRDDEVRIAMWVIAKDEKHAVKIVNEKRTQLIAENKWPEIKEIE